MKPIVLQFVTLCSLETAERFWGTYHVDLQGQIVSQENKPMEAGGKLCFFCATQCYNPEEHNASCSLPWEAKLQQFEWIYRVTHSHILINWNGISVSMWLYLLCFKVFRAETDFSVILLLFQISLPAAITVARILLSNHSHAYVVAEHISGVAPSTVIFRMSVEKNRDFSAHTVLTVARSNPISSNIYGTSIKPLLQASWVLHYFHRNSVYNYCQIGRLCITFLYTIYVSCISNNLLSCVVYYSGFPHITPKLCKSGF